MRNEVINNKLFVFLFFHPLFLCLTTVYLLVLCLQGYCWLWSHPVTHTETHGRTPLGRRIGPSLRTLPDNAQHSQDTEFHVYGGIRTRNPSNREAPDARLELHSNRDRHTLFANIKKIKSALTVLSVDLWNFVTTKPEQGPMGRGFQVLYRYKFLA